MLILNKSFIILFENKYNFNGELMEGSTMKNKTLNKINLLELHFYPLKNRRFGRSSLLLQGLKGSTKETYGKLFLLLSFSSARILIAVS